MVGTFKGVSTSSFRKCVLSTLVITNLLHEKNAIKRKSLINIEHIDNLEVDLKGDYLISAASTQYTNADRILPYSAFSFLGATEVAFVDLFYDIYNELLTPTNTRVYKLLDAVCSNARNSEEMLYVASLAANAPDSFFGATVLYFAATSEETKAMFHEAAIASGVSPGSGLLNFF